MSKLKSAIQAIYCKSPGQLKQFLNQDAETYAKELQHNTVILKNFDITYESKVAYSPSIFQLTFFYDKDNDYRNLLYYSTLKVWEIVYLPITDN